MAWNKEPPVFPNNINEYFLEKPLPSSEDAERVILGSVLLDRKHLDEASEILLTEDFYSPLNRRVYAAMLVLDEQSKPIDPITIGEVLKKESSLESIGGITVITNLTFGLPNFPNIAEYIKIVKDHSLARQFVRLNNDLTSETLSDESDIHDVLEQAEARLFELRDNSSTQGFFHVGALATSSVDHAHSISMSGNVLTGLSTGFIDLDSLTLGLNRKDLIIVAGRPSMGKTALGIGLGQNAAIRGEATVAIFSLEMGRQQLVDRMICSEARVDSMLYRVGMLDTAKWDRIEAARASIENSKIFIDDTAGISPGYMRPRLRRLKSSQGALDLVVVDYLQLMDDPRYSRQGRQQEITYISRQLKGIAKEFDVPVVAISQLSRKPEGRNDHKPIMSDLRESGSIEQDADIVAFIYRDDYYNEASEVPGIAEIIISKNRNGPTGSKNLAFDKPSTRFDNLSMDF